MNQQATDINLAQGRRTNTRLAAVKALYSSEINTKIDISKSPAQLTLDILSFYEQTEAEDDRTPMDADFLAAIIQGVCEHRETLDTMIRANLTEGWKLERLGPVLCSILRAAVFELTFFQDTPLKVVINEYVSITRGFFDEKEVGFANGILDKIAHRVRDDG